MMDKVFADGCGVADLVDVVACAQAVRSFDGVDTRRGVGIAGHSWGGFLTLRALTTPGPRR
jgi:dipeptidyl aminopeptidase/acylaminoacyl peptidase